MISEIVSDHFGLRQSFERGAVSSGKLAILVEDLPHLVHFEQAFFGGTLFLLRPQFLGDSPDGQQLVCVWRALVPLRRRGNEVGL